MKELKEGHQGSVFPVKLLMAYVATYSCLFPTILFFACFNNSDYPGSSWNSDNALQGWNAELCFRLVLCIPLLCVIISAFWFFKKMPFFASAMILFAAWYIVTTLSDYFQKGFELSAIYNSPIKWNEFPVATFAMICAAPFIVVYLYWRFWLRKQAGGLPTPAA